MDFFILLKVEYQVLPLFIWKITKENNKKKKNWEKFAQQSYYSEAIQLLKGYKPIIDKIGEPISAGFIDVSDDFNYHEEKNEKIARVSLD